MKYLDYRIFEVKEDTPIDREWMAKIYNSSGQLTSTISADLPGDRLYEDVDSVYNQSFHKRRAAGEIFNNPYEKQVFTRSVIEGSYTFSHTGGSKVVHAGNIVSRMQDYVEGIYPGPVGSVIPGDKVTEAIYDCKAHLLAKMDSGDYDFGEDFAEMHKTYLGIQSAASRLRDFFYIVSLRTKELHFSGYDLYDAFRKAWLELRYQWRPLQISFDNAAEALKEGLDKRDVRHRITHSIELFENVDRTYQTTPLAGGTADWFESHSSRIIVTVGSLYNVNDPRDSIPELLGLSYKDIVPTLWAVTRFSFLVDRYVDIMTSLKGIQNILDPQVQFLANWVTIRSTNDRVIIPTDWQVGNGYTGSGNLGSVRETSNFVNRSPYHPTFRDVIPRVGFDDSWTTALDLVTIFGPRNPLVQSLSTLGQTLNSET